MNKKETFNFWNSSKEYYDSAHADSTPLDRNPALRKLLRNCKSGMKILDVGCGEGSKINDIYSRVKDTKCFGVDISDLAIKRAKKFNSKIDFKTSDIERLPYEDNSFDIVYSTYVFEHTVKPMKILKEMIRVTKKGGKVIIVCPNFGSPLYPSPITSKFSHFVRCILRDTSYIFLKPKKLEWYDETPVLDQGWKPDYDTTILPYVYSLNVLFKKSICSSSWKGQRAGSSLGLKVFRSPFKFLGLMKIYPFIWWGPILYFELKK